MHVGSRWNPYKTIFNLIDVEWKNNLNWDSYMHKFRDIFQKLFITTLFLIDINTLIDIFDLMYWYSKLNDHDPWFKDRHVVIVINLRVSSNITQPITSNINL